MRRSWFRSFYSHLAGGILAIGFVCFAGPASATGRTELNQAVVDAAGGFPFSIAAPGNYVLTGSLTVPANTDAFVLTTNEVVFDLNGFSIAGPATCNSSSCPSGTGMAIRGFSGIAHARRTTVRNGTIRGFGSNCVQLGAQSRIDDLLVTECGGNGIVVSGGGVITNNRVLQVGERGISMATGPNADSYSSNTVASAGLGTGSFRAISGGKPGRANVCDDGSCNPLGMRRYYLSKTRVNGGAPLGVCSAGFHMASRWEILDPTSLRYDVELGETAGDSGSGPSAVSSGWVRTGGNNYDSGVLGLGNCNGWTSSSASFGTSMMLSAYIPFSETVSQPTWIVDSLSCGALRAVWCIED